MEADLSSSSISNNDKEELLKSAKVKMEEVREENERLKKLLAQIVKEYNSLEKQISSMTRSEASSETQNSTDNHKLKEGTQERDLISLSLGSWNNNSEKRREDRETKAQSSINNSDNSSEKRRKVEEGLELGLDCRFEQYTKTTNREVASESVNNSTTMDDSAIVVKREEDAIANWPPSRDLKAKEAGNGREKDEESLHQPQVKKTRVCIRSRCDSPTVHDGCQWRKYGQKIAKGNPCPRAYYRCTVSSNCPVRKQVQRCPQDMSILITTYEGNHNHPLPLSATAMASATTAAAAMLKTGSLTSHHHQQHNNNNHLTTTSSTLPTTSSYGLHASNLITTFNNNPSMITAASHNSHPTVTLDLTTANPDYSPFSWPFNSASSSSSSSRNSSSFLNFSSSPSNNFSSLDFGANNNNHNNNGNITRANSGFLGNYGTLFPNNSTNINNNDISKSIYQSLNSHHQALNETIAAAATKAIASNPNFQSVLEAAISSYVGSNNNNNNNNNNSINNVFKNNNNNNNNNVNNNNNSSASEGGSLALFPASTSSMKNNSSNASGDTRDSST